MRIRRLLIAALLACVATSASAQDLARACVDFQTIDSNDGRIRASNSTERDALQKIGTAVADGLAASCAPPPPPPPPPASVTIPNVVGQSQTAAQATLTGAGLAHATASAASEVYAAGTVLTQSPVAGTSVAPGALVTLTVSSGPAPPPPPPPPPVAGALLDDFTSLRKAHNGTDNLWRHYGEGAGGSVSVSNGMLVESVSSCSNSNGGGVYGEFYSKANNGTSYAFPSAYAQSYVLNGTWDASYNRLTFRVKTSKAIGRASDGSANFEFGTYVRKHGNSDPAFAGDHYYHQMGLSFPADRWVYITINRVPQHKVGASKPEPNYGENPTGSPYFDDLTRFYFDGTYCTGAGATWTYDDFMFSRVEGEPDTLVSSVSTYYDGSRYHTTWAGPRNKATSFTVRYATASMKAGGFSSGTLGGTVSAPGNDYTGVEWVSTTMPPSPTGMFIAIQPVGQTSFTEVFVP